MSGLLIHGKGRYYLTTKLMRCTVIEPRVVAIFPEEKGTRRCEAYPSLICVLGKPVISGQFKERHFTPGVIMRLHMSVKSFMYMKIYMLISICKDSCFEVDQL